MLPISCKSIGFEEPVVGYWSWKIMSHTIFVRNKHIIIIIINFLNSNFVILCNILLWEEICQDYLVLHPTCLILRSNPYKIYLVVLTLGVRGVLFSYKGAEVSETDHLY